MSNISSETELDSSKSRDKETKIAFLGKLISCVENILDLTIDLKPTKVIAGLEADKTCYFFQLFVLAARLGTFDHQITDSPGADFEAEERELVKHTTLADGNDVMTLSESTIKDSLKLEPMQDEASRDQGSNLKTDTVSEAKHSTDVEFHDVDDNQTNVIEQATGKIPLAKVDNTAPNDKRIAKLEAKQSISELFFGSNEGNVAEVEGEASLVSARPKTALRRPSSVRESEDENVATIIIHQARPFVTKANKTVKELISSDGESDDEE